MNEVERVRTMLAEGKITASEAERLIDVLEEVEDVEHDLAAAGTAADRAAVQAEPPQAAPTDAADSWPDSGRWVRVSMLAGDLDVRLDPAIDQPLVRSAGDGEETVAVEPEDDGFRISQFGGGKGDLLDRLVGGFRRSDLEVRLPPGFGLHLDVKAGDVTVRGVPYLRGNLLAGDLDASGLRGVDLSMQAGDVDLDLAPQSGQHRVRVSAGDVTVRLRPDASVEVKGRVSIGEVNVSGGGSSQRSGLGATLAATVGAGDASLDLRLSTGQLTLEVRDE